MDIEMDIEMDGVVKISNVFNKNDIDIFKNIYYESWNEIKSYPLEWHTLIYKENSKKYDNFIGLDLYANKKYSTYKNTIILDMSKNRFDFTYNLNTLKNKIVLPPIITNTLQKLLHCEYDYYYGGLPMEPIMNSKVNTNIFDDNNGLWHRDAYSLFDDEALDLSLPPFYYTILIPLDNIDEYSGGTQFILDSHKINLSKMNITNNDKLNKWINENKHKIYTPKLKVGDICLFHGYTIHRGLFNYSSNTRNLIYIVIKKNWYNDEPTENYINII
jgi:hypothetical protein